MNFAFSTLLILVILIPGFAFFRGYFSGEFSKQFIKLTTSDTIIIVIVPALLIQLIAEYYLQRFHSTSIDFAAIGMLLTGNMEIAQTSKVFNDMEGFILQLIGYNVFLALASFFSGFFAKLLVRNLKLDRRFKIFRFQNIWHYLLSLEIFEILRFSGNRKFSSLAVPEFIYVDLMVETSTGPVIYKGILETYFLGSNGSLEKLIISDVYKKSFSSDGEGDFRPIPSELFIVKYSDVKNINIRHSVRKGAPPKTNFYKLIGRIWALGLPFIIILFVFLRYDFVAIILLVIYLLLFIISELRR